MLRFVDGRIDLRRDNKVYERFEVGSTKMIEGGETTVWKATGQGMNEIDVARR